MRRTPNQNLLPAFIAIISFSVLLPSLTPATGATLPRNSDAACSRLISSYPSTRLTASRSEVGVTLRTRLAFLRRTLITLLERRRTGSSLLLLLVVLLLLVLLLFCLGECTRKLLLWKFPWPKLPLLLPLELVPLAALALLLVELLAVVVAVVAVVLLASLRELGKLRVWRNLMVESGPTTSVPLPLWSLSVLLLLTRLSSFNVSEKEEEKVGEGLGWK